MRISIRHIQETVGADFSVSSGLLLSRCRTLDVVRARHVGMYLARTLTPHSLTVIARLFGRDHTTVMSGIISIKKHMAGNRSLALKIEARGLLLQCELQKVVDTSNVGFLPKTADLPPIRPQAIHQPVNTDLLDDRQAAAA